MLTVERLETLLRGLELPDAVIEVNGSPGHLFAKLVSTGFSGQEEAIRQERVWKYLSEHLSEFEQTEVDFVFTSTPDEDAAEKA